MSKKQAGGWLYGVYHILEPNRLRYAGITTVSIKSRSHGHWSNAKIDRPGKTHYGPIRSWLKKHLDSREDVEFREIGYFDAVEELKKAEIDLIAESRKVGECDLNLTDGGEGGNGWKHTEESKRKLSEAFSGDKNPMYGRNRRELMAYALTFKGPVTEEMKSNLSEKMLAHWSERPEKRESYSNRVKGYWEEGRMTPITQEKALEMARSRKSTLPDDVVASIRKLRNEGWSYSQITKQVGVPEYQVRSALGQRGSYSWVPEEGEAVDWKVARLMREGLEEEDIRRIRGLYDQGVSNREIKDNHYPGLKISKIQHITSRRGYQWVTG